MLIERVINKIKWKNTKFKSRGTNSNVGVGFRIWGKEYISIGDNFSAEQRLYLQAWKISGKNEPELVIGNNVSIMDNCQISCAEKVVIGNGVLFGSNVFVTDNFHGRSEQEELSIPPLNRELYVKGPVSIGNNVWVGRNVCIMPGVSIGDGVVIGANAVVTKDIPAGCIVAGVPAVVIK